MVPLLVFVGFVVVIVGSYAAAVLVPAWLTQRQVARRLQDVGPVTPDGEPAIVMARRRSPLPSLDAALAQSSLGPRVTSLIEQSGLETTAGALLLSTVLCGIAGAAAAVVLLPNPLFALVLAPAGAALPVLRLLRRRSVRLRRFEEQFPEALDLLSRAIRAGHAFQTSLGMVASELEAPVGQEFKKVFDQQNFGLPLRDALNQMAERVPHLDVRFFVTAVGIQRDTGGNLAEILDNLAHVVRERFKIRRQVRVHTAHGRFTGYVLLGLPAFLAVALSFIAPDQMKLLFYERLGQMMVAGAMVLQTIGFFWIRQVIKIEV